MHVEWMRLLWLYKLLIIVDRLIACLLGSVDQTQVKHFVLIVFVDNWDKHEYSICFPITKQLYSDKQKIKLSPSCHNEATMNISVHALCIRGNLERGKQFELTQKLFVLWHE